MSETLLQIRDLTVGAPKAVNPIIEKVNIEVKKKQIIGIVGESGCGKSMTSLAAMRLLPPGIQILSGSVLFNGQELTTFSEKEMQKIRGKDISMIFQEPVRALHPLHKIGSQIEESLELHTNLSKKERRETAVSLMRSVGIPEPELRYGQYPHQLSGGLNQRAMIAMAIADHPELLIADEPTTALDVTIQAQILRLLRSLREELGISVILISHDLAVICENCDYVYVMYCGQVVEAAEIGTFFASPRHPYSKALILASPDPGKKVEDLQPIPGTVPPIEQFPKGCRFADRCSYCTDRCRREAPSLYVQQEGAAVRCFLYERKEGEDERNSD